MSWPVRRNFSLLATVIGVLLALGGFAAIGYGIASQDVAARAPSQPAAPVDPYPQGSVPTRAGTDVAAQGLVLDASKPVSIRIPAIDVTSSVNKVGLNADGTMEVPQMGSNYNEAAWYRYSPTPGELGPSVIVGHIDSAKKGPSVFFDLADLRPGDKVFVERRDGVTAVFVVDSVRRYPKDDFPTEVVYGDTGYAALRLITCGGTFNEQTDSYRSNIVVFAHLVDARR